MRYICLVFDFDGDFDGDGDSECLASGGTVTPTSTWTPTYKASKEKIWQRQIPYRLSDISAWLLMQGVDFDTDSNFDSDIDRAYLFLSMKAKADPISPLRYICLAFDFDFDFDGDFDSACHASGEKAVP